MAAWPAGRGHLSSGVQKIRVGVIGSGAIVSGALAEMRSLAALTPVALYARPSARRDQLAGEFDLVAFDELDALLRAPIDALYIAQPNFLHASTAIAGLQAGKHVLLEKPFALNLQEANAVAAAHAEARQLCFLVAMNQRYGEQAEWARATLPKIGEPYRVRASWLRRAGIPGEGTWFTEKALAGGGVLIDLGVHLIDRVFDLLGDFQVEEVSAKLGDCWGRRGRGVGGWSQSTRRDPGEAAPRFDVEDYAQLQLSMRSGLSVQLELSWAAPVEQEELSIEIWGTEGALRLPEMRFLPGPEGRQPTTSAAASSNIAARSIAAPPSAAFPNIFARFEAAILQGAPLQKELHEALQVQAVLDAAYASALADKPMKIEVKQ